MQVSETISEFISKTFLNDGEKQLSQDDPLLEGGILDSAGIFELVTFLEQTFDIAVEDEEIVIENFANIGCIARMVESKQD